MRVSVAFCVYPLQQVKNIKVTAVVNSINFELLADQGVSLK